LFRSRDDNRGGGGVTGLEPAKTTAAFLFRLALLASLFLAYERQGMLPWGSALLSVIGLLLVPVPNRRQPLRAWA